MELDLVLNIIISLSVLIPTLLSIAIITLCERKVMGKIQRRIGPTTTGYYGLLQPISDALKLLVKEIIIPINSDSKIYLLPSIWIFIIGLISYICIYFSYNTVYIDFDFNILYFLVISSLTIYGLLFAGLFSGSKYSILGGIRATCSMISYEISIGLIIISIFFGTNYNISSCYHLPYSNLFLSIPIAFLYLISILAEVNRVPFDITEAESELTAGPYTEYSSLPFAYFFLAEYSSLLSQSIIFSNIFLTFPFIIYNPFFDNIFLSLKTVLIIFLFILFRASLPRVRWDKMMLLCWSYLLPSSLIFLILHFLIYSLFNIYF